MEKSFGKQVGRRAWFSAWQFFESKTRDAILFAALFAAGGVAYYLLFGWPAAKEQIVPVLIFTVGPIVGLWVLLFLWHLWLAPAALAYESAKSDAIRPVSSAPPVPAQKAINWGVWRQMDSWSIQQFAAILAKDDPAVSRMGTEQSAFYKLIKADVGVNKLPYIREMMRSYDGSGMFEKTINSETKIERNAAIKWADAHVDFDVNHVR